MPDLAGSVTADMGAEISSMMCGKRDIIDINKKKKVAKVELFLLKRVIKATLGIDFIKNNKMALVS